MSVKLDVHLGASYDRWCDLHQVRHYGADLHVLDQDGQAIPVGTVCEDTDITAEQAFTECIESVWDAVADCRETVDGGDLARWVDLDTDAQQSLRPVLEALVKHIATSIPEQR